MPKFRFDKKALPIHSTPVRVIWQCGTFVQCVKFMC